jgi:hypothetical protein
VCGAVYCHLVSKIARLGWGLGEWCLLLWLERPLGQDLKNLFE